VRSLPEEIPHFVELQNRYRDQGLQIVGVSMDDSPEPVRDFYRQFKMNYPVVMGNASTGELYGGVLGLPIAFLIGRDGRIYSKHIGATDIAVFERKSQCCCGRNEALAYQGMRRLFLTSQSSWIGRSRTAVAVPSVVWLAVARFGA